MDRKFSHDASSTTEVEAFIPDQQLSPPSSARRWPWIFGTLFFSLLTVGLLLNPSVTCTDSGGLQSWKESDFFGARDFIEYENVPFYGNGKYDENGTFYIPQSSHVDYTGPPSPEVDAAWEHLTGERDFLITEKEAKVLWGDEYQRHWHFRKGGYSIGLDMFHTLHCLNNLRKLYYPEYYPAQPGHEAPIVAHRGHCIDQIRQYIMCAGDVSAYGTLYFSNPGRNYADSDVVHTCRNFNKLREYARNRYHTGGDLHLKGVDVWHEWREDNDEY